MPTIIDSLFISLGWDLSEFRKGNADIANAKKKARDDALATGKEVEAGAKRQRDAFSATKGELLGLLGVLTAGAGIKEFVTGQITSAAATGRLAHNLSVSTEELSAWQGVLRRAGGTSQDANNDLQNLVGTFEQIRLTGQSPLIPYLQLLNISLRDLEDPTDTLLKMADAFQRMDPRLSAKLGADMGMSPAMISTLQRGRSAVTSLLEEQRRLGVVTAEDARQAQDLQDKIEGVKDSSARLGRTLLTSLAPALSDGLKGLEAIGQNETFLGFLDAASLGVRALGGVARATFDLIGGLLRGVAQLLSGDFSEAWSTARNTVRDVLGDMKGALEGTAAAAVKFWDTLRGHTPSASGAAPTPAATATPGGGTGQDAMVAFFRAHGWPEAAARGTAAGIMAESGGDPNAFNGAGGGRGALGIGQWRGSRIDDFERVMRRPLRGSSMDDQLRFMQWELNNSERSAGASIYGAGNETAALSAYVNRYMRPAAGRETVGDMSRGQRALAQQTRGAGGRTTNVTVTGVTVNTRATDANGVARDFGRGLSGYVQSANQGVL
jgi:hypothetical protein